MYNFLQIKRGKQIVEQLANNIFLLSYVGIVKPKIKNFNCHYIFVIKNDYIQRVITHIYT